MDVIRTLIVDDEILARTRIRNLLRDRAEFALVGECSNGNDAVAVIGAERPELVFLDVQMPGIDGIETTRRITALPDPPAVVVMSTHESAVPLQRLAWYCPPVKA